MEIDTTSNQYLQLYNGIATLRTHMTPKLIVFATLPRAKQKLWLQKDKLLRRTIKLAVDLKAWTEQFDSEMEELDD